MAEKTISLDDRMAQMIGSNERCIYCNQWVPQYPIESWTIVVTADTIGVAHNYRTFLCMPRDRSKWQLNYDARC